MSPTKEMTPATLRNALSLFSIKVLKESGINDKCKKECKKSIKNRLKIFSSNCDNLKKEETKSNKKQKPKQKPKFPIPFCGIVEKTWCKGIKKNHNLYTQCVKAPEDNCEYCKICGNHAKNSSTGKPQYGNIWDRKKAWDKALNNDSDMVCWKPDGLTLELPYINVMEKLGIELSDAQNELDKLGWGPMPNCHMEKRIVKRGRPAKNKVAVEDSDDETPKKRGRPKKVEEREPTNEELIALMAAALA